MLHACKVPLLISQVYLKLQSSCILFPNESHGHKGADLEVDTAVGMGMEQKTDAGEESDGDDVWNGMETVGGRRKRIKGK